MSINWTNKLGPKPIINQSTPRKGLDAAAGSPIYDTPETEEWIKSNVGLHAALANAIEQMKKLECERNDARRMWSIHQDKLAEVRSDIIIVLSTARQNLPRKHGTIERIAEKYLENANVEARQP